MNTSIFGMRQSAVTVDPLTESLSGIETGYIDGTPSSLQEILTESAAEMYKHEASYYISDIIMTESVMEGAELEPLMESFVSSAWEKLKKVFTTLWAKVRSWFEKAKSSIKLIFLSGDKFIKEFKSQLEKKDTAGFKYTGHNYTIDKGDATVRTKRDAINSFLKSEVHFDLSAAQKEVTGVNRSSAGEHGQDEHIRANAGGSGATYNESEAKEKLREKVGNKDLSAILKQVRADYHNDQKMEIVSIDVNHMISFIQKNAGSIKAIEDAQSQMNSEFKEVLSSIDGARAKINASKDTEAEKARLTTYATHKYNVAHYGLTLQLNLSNLQASIYSAAGREYEKALKSLLRYKAAKPEAAKEGTEEVLEGNDNVDNNEPVVENTTTVTSREESILDAATRWL